MCLYMFCCNSFCIKALFKLYWHKKYAKENWWELEECQSIISDQFILCLDTVMLNFEY